MWKMEDLPYTLNTCNVNLRWIWCIGLRTLPHEKCTPSVVNWIKMLYREGVNFKWSRSCRPLSEMPSLPDPAGDSRICANLPVSRIDLKNSRISEKKKNRPNLNLLAVDFYFYRWSWQSAAIGRLNCVWQHLKHKHYVGPLRVIWLAADCPRSSKNNFKPITEFVV